MSTKQSSFEARIDAAINSTPHLARRDLHYVIDEGRVVLKGVVGTYFQKQMAQEVVRRVDGVRHVDNELEVSWH